MTNLDSILKSRDIILSTKVHLVKVLVFPLVTNVCESWIIKKAERRRIDAFELWCWKRFLRGPLDCKEIQPVHPEGNQSWVFMEGLMLKLKLQYFGHLIWRTYSFEKTLMLGKIEGWRKRGLQRMRWLDGITDSMDMNLSNSGSWWWTGRPGGLQSMGSKRVWLDWATDLNWTEEHTFYT